MPPNAVHDPGRLQRPSPGSAGQGAPDTGFGHTRIVFQRQRLDSRPSYMAAEADDRPCCIILTGERVEQSRRIDGITGYLNLKHP